MFGIRLLKLQHSEKVHHQINDEKLFASQADTERAGIRELDFSRLRPQHTTRVSRVFSHQTCRNQHQDENYVDFIRYHFDHCYRTAEYKYIATWIGVTTLESAHVFTVISPLK
jgi:Arc/MetJ-type ribon-helix-helix transcriptional regulator